MNEWIDLMKNKLLITINISKQKANLINYKEQLEIWNILFYYLNPLMKKYIL